MADYIVRRYDTTPLEDDSESRCDVCGFGLELDQLHATEETVFVYHVTGTVWHDADISKIDKKVESVIPAGTNCPFCGSNRFADGGRRGSL